MHITRLQFRAFLPAVLFAAIVLAINGHWFRVPLIEGSDFAAADGRADRSGGSAMRRKR
jgi:hypothetical protein